MEPTNDRTQRVAKAPCLLWQEITHTKKNKKSMSDQSHETKRTSISSALNWHIRKYARVTCVNGECENTHRRTKTEVHGRVVCVQM